MTTTDCGWIWLTQLQMTELFQPTKPEYEPAC